jgi:hypothetical protein
MKGSIRNLVTFGMLTAISIGSAGCYQLTRASVHDKVISKFPTYAQTKASWDPVPEGYGRVVIFCPRNTASWLGPGGTGYIVLWIKVDKLDETPLVDQTFVFIDLPAGEHSIRLGGDLVYSPVPLVFEVITGEFIYINAGLKLVPDKEAQPLLKNIHHSFQKPLPYDKQQKSADHVWSNMQRER